MDRRDTLKTLLVGTIGGATIGTVGCTSNMEKKQDGTAMNIDLPLYGRLPEEIAHDQKILNETFLNTHELETIAVLCDIILPPTPTAGSANDAGVPAFIELIVKDLPDNQIPLRGGLMWLDGESNKRFNKEFSSALPAQQIQIIDDIAYPDPENKKPEMAYGIKFFSLVRNLTLTGYYTTRIGFDDLGYKGNTPTVWDGVPDDVLKDHDVDYDPEWIAKCVDQEKRDIVAQWDENGKLIS
jgi:gluconate 2-dehydrogenase subunit 3-like protein